MKRKNQVNLDHQPAPRRPAKRDTVLAAQLAAYAAAHKEAKKNGLPRPHINDYVGGK